MWLTTQHSIVVYRCYLYSYSGNISLLGNWRIHHYIRSKLDPAELFNNFNPVRTFASSFPLFCHLHLRPSERPPINFPNRNCLHISRSSHYFHTASTCFWIPELLCVPKPDTEIEFACSLNKYNFTGNISLLTYVTAKFACSCFFAAINFINRFCIHFGSGKLSSNYVKLWHR
jgi:hypothetical protein